jgi:uncharacterized protein (TIGR02453 family)
MPGKRAKTTGENGGITAETFRFFRDLDRNNRTEWMNENRDRYRAAVVEPFRGLLAELTPVVHQLDAGFDIGFDISGRTGVNFSRINRDIRFAKDKTPYRPQMYLMFPPLGGKNRGPGELYVGLSKDVATAGFRVYLDRDSKAALGARIAKASKFCAQQKRRIGRRFESYWYSMEKGEWTKNDGWPLTPEDWKKLRAWIVRKKLSPAAAVRPGFAKQVAVIFREAFPLFRFLSH